MDTQSEIDRYVGLYGEAARLRIEAAVKYLDEKGARGPLRDKFVAAAVRKSRGLGDILGLGIFLDAIYGFFFGRNQMQVEITSMTDGQKLSPGVAQTVTVAVAEQAVFSFVNTVELAVRGPNGQDIGGGGGKLVNGVATVVFTTPTTPGTYNLQASVRGALGLSNAIAHISFEI